MSSNDITLDIGSRIGLSMEVSQSVSHMSPAPYIGENGNWYVYDNVTGEYVDSGTEARGPKGEDGVQIDDEHVSDETVWSSYKTNEQLDGKLGIADYSAAAAVGTADNLIDRKAQGTTQNWTGMRTSCGDQSIEDDGYAQIRQITGIGVYGGVKATAIKTVGFNAYNNATGTAALLGGNEYQITGEYTALSYSTGEEITPDGDGLFTPTANGVLTVTGGNATTTCVHLTWSGYRNGEYESYWENTLVLPIAQYFPNGMYATRHGDVGTNYASRVDTIESTRATKRMNVVNIKNCTIIKREKENQFEVTSGFDGQQIPGSNGARGTIPCFLNSKGWDVYPYTTMNGDSPYDKSISPRVRSNRGCIFEDSDFATYWQNDDIDGLKAAMGDVYVVYTLASAVVTEIDPPLNLQYKVADFGTEEAIGGTFNGTVAYSSDFTRMIVNNSDHIGTLSDLQTTAKNNLVAAINEVAQGGSGGGAGYELIETITLAESATTIERKKDPQGNDYDLLDLVLMVEIPVGELSSKAVSLFLTTDDSTIMERTIQQSNVTTTTYKACVVMNAKIENGFLFSDSCVSNNAFTNIGTRCSSANSAGVKLANKITGFYIKLNSVDFAAGTTVDIYGRKRT